MKLFSTQIVVPVDSNSVLQGALEVKHVLEETIAKYNLGSQVSVVETGALGIYDQGVVLAVFPDDVYYGGVKPADIEEIVTEHLLKGRIVSRLVHRQKPVKQASGREGDRQKPAEDRPEERRTHRSTEYRRVHCA